MVLAARALKACEAMVSTRVLRRKRAFPIPELKKRIPKLASGGLKTRQCSVL